MRHGAGDGPVASPDRAVRGDELGRLVAVLLRQPHGREVELLPRPHVVAVAPVDPAPDQLDAARAEPAVGVVDESGPGRDEERGLHDPILAPVARPAASTCWRMPWGRAPQAGARNALSAPAYIAGSSAPISSRVLCIDSAAAPKSTVVAPVSDDVTGPTVEPHGRSLRVTKVCIGHPGLLAGEPERRGADGVRGVAQVGVDLEHRAAVDADLVQRLVAVGVVGVRGVAHVARGDDGAGEGAPVVVAGAAAGGDDALEDRRQQRRGGAALGRAADLLVVEEDEDRDVGGLGGHGVEQGPHAGIRRGEVVEPRARR